MYSGNSEFDIKTEMYWGGGRRERETEYTLERYLRNATSQHCHSWRNGVPTDELLSSLVYLFSKWQCQWVQLCLVYVARSTQAPVH